MPCDVLPLESVNYDDTLQPQYYHENRCPRTLSLLRCQESGQIGNICLSQQVKTTNNHNNALAIQHFPPATLFSVKFCCDGKRKITASELKVLTSCAQHSTQYMVNLPTDTALGLGH